MDGDRASNDRGAETERGQTCLEDELGSETALIGDTLNNTESIGDIKED